jgi:hypothetical protein
MGVYEVTKLAIYAVFELIRLLLEFRRAKSPEEDEKAVPR